MSAVEQQRHVASNNLTLEEVVEESHWNLVAVVIVVAAAAEALAFAVVVASAVEKV